MREGILGGSFDPVHHGHLHIARACVARLALDRLLLMPARIPPHKMGRPMTDATHRLAMIRLAIADESRIDVSTLELDREGTTYTVDTIRALLDREDAPDELFFIVGADQALELPTWRTIDELARLCTIVPVARAGICLDCLDDLTGKLPDDVVARLKSAALDVPPVDVSSTQIRERIRAGKPVDALVTPAVAAYIDEHGLYRD